MRLNKMRLAAAMMSAVMAASTMSTAAFAEDLIVDEGVSVVSEGATVDELVEDQAELATTGEVKIVDGSIEFDSDTMVLKYQVSNETEKRSVKLEGNQATMTQAQSCTKAEIYYIDYLTAYGSIKMYYQTKDAAGHKWGDAYKVVDEEPTCVADGKKVEYHKCSVCGLEAKTGAVDETIPHGDSYHSYDETKTKTTYVLGTNTKYDATGMPVLDNESRNGSYTVKTEKFCVFCKNTVTTEKTVSLDAKGTAFSKAIITGFKNIKGYAGTDTKELTHEQYTALDPEDFTLTDCSKTGEYTITVYYTDGTHSVGTKVIVPIHHVPVVEVKAKDDKEQHLLSVVYKADGTVESVTSKSCYKDVTYVEVTKCSSKGEVLSTSEEKVAQHAGQHQYKAEVKTTVDNLYKIANAYDGLTRNNDQQNMIDFCLNYFEANKDYLTYTKDFECSQGGTITATCLCERCGQPMADTTKVIKVGKIDHVAGDPTNENEVKPTCSQEGSADQVTRCSVCDTVMNTKKVTIPKLNHKYAAANAGLAIEIKGSVLVDWKPQWVTGDTVTVLSGDYLGRHQQSRGLTFNLYDTCVECGEKVIKEKEDLYLNVKFIEIVPEDGKGNPGSVTVEATYTIDGKTITSGEQTFNYFSDLAAYLARNPETDVKDGLVLEDGKFCYYENGQFKASYTGFVDYDGETFYVVNGVLDTANHGLTLIDGKWYNLSLGRLAKEYTGLVPLGDLAFYVTEGVFDPTLTGLVDYNGGTFLFIEGRLAKEANGLWQYEKVLGGDDQWYFMAYGQVQKDFTGTTYYDGATFELVDGKLVG